MCERGHAQRFHCHGDGGNIVRSFPCGQGRRVLMEVLQSKTIDLISLLPICKLKWRRPYLSGVADGANVISVSGHIPRLQ
jgi:hypothetical protein